MRIGGYGSGGGFPGRDPGPEERRKRFAARHRIGDTVRGRVLRAETPDLTWVAFEASELLVPGLAGFPPGSLVDFRIKSLTPEIVLAPLGPAPDGPAALAAAAARFLAARAAFEAGLDPCCTEEDALTRALAAAIAEVNSALPAGLTLSCPHDLIPEARELECLVREASGHSPRGAELSFRLPGVGRVRASLIAGEQVGSLRLRAEHPEAAEALAWRLTRPEGNPLRQPLDRLGIAPLPANAPGALAEIMRATKGMGRSRVV